jgi:hypothetical protein
MAKCMICGAIADEGRYYCNLCTEDLILAGVPLLGELYGYSIAELVSLYSQKWISIEELENELDARASAALCSLF